MTRHAIIVAMLVIAAQCARAEDPASSILPTNVLQAPDVLDAPRVDAPVAPGMVEHDSDRRDPAASTKPRSEQQ
jgi:hypothetical protein